jgi:hypothetical protein
VKPLFLVDVALGATAAIFWANAVIDRGIHPFASLGDAAFAFIPGLALFACAMRSMSLVRKL